MSIREVPHKIKLFFNNPENPIMGELYIPLIIILVAFCSFGLGRLSTIHNTKPPIILENNALETESANKPSPIVLGGETSKNQKSSPQTASTASLGSSAPKSAAATSESGSVVASKNGKKYHFPFCAGARTISPTNLITFASIEEARTAGYTPAANCKGLK
ncbi:MAG TPA: hypothetical protein VJH55_02370 [Candidatus Paceibacterota bacterium]